MRVTLKKIYSWMWIAVLLIGIALPCSASAENGKVTVTLEDLEKNGINGVTVCLCQVAELNNTGYYPTVAFENSGISIAGIVNNPNEATAKTVVDFVTDNNVATLSAVSQSGKVSFSELDLGIWVVFPEKDSKYTFSPHIVFIPFESKGKLYYEVSSAPKIVENKPDEISIYVIKKWDDKNNASKNRPSFVTVELLDGETVVTSVQLSEENGWAHTFSNLSKSANYSVREIAVDNYKADYSGDTINGFVITNTYNGEKLPQTGQYWWPIALISVAGICLISLGIYEIGTKKNGKKK